MQIDVLQDVIRGGGIFKTDILEIHRTLDVSQDLRMRIILNVRLNFHDFHKPLEAGDAFLKLLGEVDQLLDRLRQVVDIKQIG